MYSKNIQDAIARFSDLTVLVVGDFMLDCFVYGALERISPEAPIPILLGREQELMLGGGGNVVANIRSLGSTALPLTVIGNDDAGNKLAAMMADLDVETEGVLVSAARKTSRKSRFIAQNQQVLRFDEEDRAALSSDDRKRLTDRLPAALEAADIVILSDYGKGVLGGGVAAEIVALCRHRGIPVLVDPKGPDYGIYAGATAVTPNRKELAEATGRPTASDAEVAAAKRA
jgi:D-beta-D-heptose 7-phosphate kinase/D-beta-D-heptose 1-phosphate adenosyltransferase